MSLLDEIAIDDTREIAVELRTQCAPLQMSESGKAALLGGRRFPHTLRALDQNSRERLE